MKSILDKDFNYTDSTHTDLKKKFAQIRREQKKQEERAQQDAFERIQKVRKIG